MDHGQTPVYCGPGPKILSPGPVPGEVLKKSTFPDANPGIEGVQLPPTPPVDPPAGKKEE
jgi:hypothetical protein